MKLKNEIDQNNVLLNEDNNSEALHGKQYLTFMVGNEKYGIAIDNVFEVIDYIKITQIPLSPPYIEGVINLRGDILPVVNLAYRFYRRKTEITKFTSFVIVEIQDGNESITMGLMIDSVKEVIFIPDEEIDEKPDFGTKIRNDFIEGVGKVSSEFIILLNTNTVLNIDELADFSGYENEGIE